MIRVSIELDAAGILKTVSAKGHAGHGAAGSDIVCAAASALIRGAVRTLQANSDALVTGAADEVGKVAVEIERGEGNRTEYMRAVGDFLMLGIQDLAAEYPRSCALRIRNRKKSGS